jgi:hypothetical protein
MEDMETALEIAIKDYYSGKRPDVYMPIDVEVFSLKDELKYQFNLVIAHAYDATIFAHDLLDSSTLEVMRYMYRKNRKFLEGDTALYLSDIDSNIDESTLLEVLSSKVINLRISCKKLAFESKDGRLSYVTGSYNDRSATISLFPLSMLVSLFPKKAKPAKNRVYNVSLKVLQNIYSQTFLHELVHAIQPCIFESECAKYLISHPSDISGTSGLSDEKKNGYITQSQHCLRFKLELLYMIQRSEIEISKVRPEIFEDVMKELLAEQALIQDVTSHAPGIFRLLSKLSGHRFLRLKDFHPDADIASLAYTWEAELAYKLESLFSMRRRVFMSRREIRKSKSLRETFKSFIRDRKAARPNYAKSKSDDILSRVWETEDFAFTSNGEANLYLAISENENPFDLLLNMVVDHDIKRLDSIPTDLIGIYVISKGSSYEIIYTQRGFEPVTISLEEAWWLLQS